MTQPKETFRKSMCLLYRFDDFVFGFTEDKWWYTYPLGLQAWGAGNLTMLV